MSLTLIHIIFCETIRIAINPDFTLKKKNFYVYTLIHVTDNFEK